MPRADRVIRLICLRNVVHSLSHIATIAARRLNRQILYEVAPRTDGSIGQCDDTGTALNILQQTSSYLKRNVVRAALNQRGSYELQITPDTELGDNDSVHSPARADGGPARLCATSTPTSRGSLRPSVTLRASVDPAPTVIHQAKAPAGPARALSVEELRIVEDYLSGRNDSGPPSMELLKAYSARLDRMSELSGETAALVNPPLSRKYHTGFVRPWDEYQAEIDVARAQVYKPFAAVPAFFMAAVASLALYYIFYPHARVFNSQTGHGHCYLVQNGCPTTPRLTCLYTVASHNQLSAFLACDGGFYVPLNGTYANSVQDWDRAVVLRLIASRSLSPFYRGLQDEWDVGDSDRNRLDRLLATSARVPAQLPSTSAAGQEPEQVPLISLERIREPPSHREAEAQAFERGTVECPICFLSFPANINYSRCCDQPICTECVVQIRRVDPTPNNLASEPVACPFCVEPDFGVTYKPPAPPYRREPDGMAIRNEGNSSTAPSSISDLAELSVSPTSGRRKSISASAASVVTVDHLHPDWQAKLEAARATAARRANRRIVFRRVGDRLIPVGVTSSRDVIAAAAAAEASLGSPPGNGTETPSRRSRRSRSGRDSDTQQYLSGLSGQDLEELMVMEAMRLSMIEQEERDKKEHSERDRFASAIGRMPAEVTAGSAAVRATLSSSAPSASAALSSPLSTASGSIPRPALGASLLTQTSPAPPMIALSDAPSQQTSVLTRRQSAHTSIASTTSRSELGSEAGYQLLEDSDD